MQTAFTNNAEIVFTYGLLHSVWPDIFINSKCISNQKSVCVHDFMNRENAKLKQFAYNFDIYTNITLQIWLRSMYNITDVFCVICFISCINILYYRYAICVLSTGITFYIYILFLYIYYLFSIKTRKIV